MGMDMFIRINTDTHTQGTHTTTNRDARVQRAGKGCECTKSAKNTYVKENTTTYNTSSLITAHDGHRSPGHVRFLTLPPHTQAIHIWCHTSQHTWWHDTETSHCFLTHTHTHIGRRHTWCCSFAMPCLSTSTHPSDRDMEQETDDTERAITRARRAEEKVVGWHIIIHCIHTWYTEWYT